MYWPETTLVAVEPFGELRRLQREMNRLFAGCGARMDVFPAVNIWSSADEAVVTAEIPGVDPKAIDVTVEGDEVTLQGERKVEETAEEVTCHRAERASGSFVRRFGLPFEVDASKVSATYKNGVLKVKLPRAETSKAKKVEIAVK